jgi:hypothetical protein
MKNRKEIGLILILAAAALNSFNLDSLESSESVIQLTLEDRKWVKKYLEEYPEILWLADADVRKTEEGEATLQGSYSEQLFGQKFIEFDRTLMTIRCLKLILEGSEKAYEEFTKDQPEKAKLTFESFQKIHQQGQQLLHSSWGGLSEEQMLQAMETALVLGDMGKSEKAREIFKPYGILIPDHDDFYGEAMLVIENQPQLSPSFHKLPPSAKKTFA